MGALTTRGFVVGGDGVSAGALALASDGGGAAMVVVTTCHSAIAKASVWSSRTVVGVPVVVVVEDEESTLAIGSAAKTSG